MIVVVRLELLREDMRSAVHLSFGGGRMQSELPPTLRPRVESEQVKPEALLVMSRSCARPLPLPETFQGEESSQQLRKCASFTQRSACSLFASLATACAYVLSVHFMATTTIMKS